MQELWILPFDHRASFQDRLKGLPLASPQAKQIADLKWLIYRGFLQSIEMGVPIEKTGLLVDEASGAPVLLDARNRGIVTALCVEKSGQEEFQFEYGDEFRQHLEKLQPWFAKALVRYNPEGSHDRNQRQVQRLRLLSDFCQSAGIGLFLELLVPPTEAQCAKLDGNTRRYEQELRGELTRTAMVRLQDAGIRPEVWSMEGFEDPSDYIKTVALLQRATAPAEGLVILGRGAPLPHVEQWLQAGASVDGVMGFAVGRTLFTEPLRAFLREELTPDQCAHAIGEAFYKLCRFWSQAKKGKGSEVPSGASDDASKPGSSAEIPL